MAPVSSSAPANPEPSDVPLRGWRRTLAALTVRDYAWYFTGNFAFFSAMQMNIILRGYLAYQLTDAATALGIVAVTFAIPMLFGAPIGGVIADRVNKRTLLIVLQVFTTLVILTMTILIFTERVVFWHLLVSAFVTAIVQSIIMPTRQAIAPQLVPQHLLMNAVSLQMATMNLTRILGPALAGFLIAPFSLGVAYAVTVGFFVVSVLTVLPLPLHGMRARRSSSNSFVADLFGGMTYVWKRPLFRLLIASALIVPLFAVPLQQMLPVFAEDVFERGPAGLGLLMASMGIGGLAGAVISASSDRIDRKGLMMLAGGALMGAGYLVFALTGSFWVALAVLAVASVGRMMFQIMSQTTLQVLVPDEYRGRVMSLLMMSFGMMPLGVLPVAIAIDHIGARATIAIHSAIGLVVLVGMVLLSPRLRGLSISALAQVELSPAQAAKLVAAGTITQEEADRRTGRTADGAAMALDDIDEPHAEPAAPVRRRGTEASAVVDRAPRP